MPVLIKKKILSMDTYSVHGQNPLFFSFLSKTAPIFLTSQDRCDIAHQ
jgi:hypothetical protein